jgi:hypothetical protein
VAHALGRGQALRAGVVPCEWAFDLAALIEQVRARGLHIEERFS